MPNMKRHIDQPDYETRCLKVVWLMNQGVDHQGLRERFGVTREGLRHMITRGRALQLGKKTEEPHHA
jgi:hypothetical protein